MIEIVVPAVLATIVALFAAILMLYPGLYRDIYTLLVLGQFIRLVRRSCLDRELAIDRFEETVKKYPHKTFLIYQEQRYSYHQADLQANRVANVLTSLGLSAGHTIALVMSNEPPFVWIFLGALKIGVRVALVNHHLQAEALRLSITSCAPNLVIVGDGLEDYLPANVADLDPPLNMPVYSFNYPARDAKWSPAVRELPSFSNLMTQSSGNHVSPKLRLHVKLSDPAAFIFTSGTTGLPKPAIISHKKMILCSQSYRPAGFSSNEVLYLCLPLYHASALNLALLNVISVGATLVLREKFSVSNFWKDCVQHEVTCFQYIGEMLRYLVNAAEKPEENNHKIWAAIGNGLRADIWTRFTSRFRVKNIFEFYGSTEVPATVINLFNVPGSVGRLSPLLSRLMNLILVRVDNETQQPYRNQRGRCEVVGPGSTGIMLLQLTDKVQFDGYLGPAADTRKRILQDVLVPGDFYVNTNDIFLLDENYNLFFKDRIGDSYRWKGENVSTAEVSSVMNSAEFVHDTNVFGVRVPGYEGKAGMAAVNLQNNESVNKDKLKHLAKVCRTKLPGFARPRFVRFQRQMSLTTTFKQQKVDLIREGFDPQVVDEPLFYLDRKTDEFKELDEDAYRHIVKGKIAL